MPVGLPLVHRLAGLSLFPKLQMLVLFSFTESYCNSEHLMVRPASPAIPDNYLKCYKQTNVYLL